MTIQQAQESIWKADDYLKAAYSELHDVSVDEHHMEREFKKEEKEEIRAELYHVTERLSEIILLVARINNL